MNGGYPWRFSRQEYRRGLPCPLPRDFPNPGLPHCMWILHPLSHRLSHSIVFLYFFALFTKESFLISPCYSLELCIQMFISFLFPLPLTSLLFLAICEASSDNHFAFLHFFFLEIVLIITSYTMLQISTHSPSGTLSIRSNPLNLFVTSTV